MQFRWHWLLCLYALKRRIGAVSLPQSAWILKYEQTFKCFAAHCVGILQGRSSHAQGYSAKLIFNALRKYGSLELIV